MSDTVPLPSTSLLMRIKAVQALRPNLQFHYVGNDIVIRGGGGAPSEQEITTAVQTLSTEKAWKKLREERDRRLSETDWHIVKAQETGSAIPPSILEYRQKLRDMTAKCTPCLDERGNVVADFPELVI
jgi:Phage tail assembly chaperone protein